MPIRSARRPQPALTALLAGVLLLCAYLMAGPGHADMMRRMPAATDSMVTGSGMPAMANGSDPSHGSVFVSDTGGDSCPAMARECPLASAQSPAPVLFAGPGAALGAEAPVGAARSARPARVSCAWPRAPDPVALLCVSRT
ncbi:hypothetical protein ABT234_13130 [Streptomyces sp. NPDC001586]|uniref:hypothetical protein n=1 Tax=Streptomyces sp. NPDC001586 TaxID=3154387 RepID=UPI00332FD6F6